MTADVADTDTSGNSAPASLTPVGNWPLLSLAINVNQFNDLTTDIVHTGGTVNLPLLVSLTIVVLLVLWISSRIFNGSNGIIRNREENDAWKENKSLQRWWLFCSWCQTTLVVYVQLQKISRIFEKKIEMGPRIIRGRGEMGWDYLGKKPEVKNLLTLSL